VLLGKYHQAKTEDIAILFIDLKSSTSLAELLGSDRFFNFLNEFHSLVEDFVRLSGGTIYKYLGDGQIVIWETKHLNDAFKMIMNLSSTLNSLQEGIIKEYHHPMQFTAGLHCGPTLVGEIGFERREIGYWGTTINIAQRIQSACKEHDATFLLSEDVYSKLDRVHQNLPNLKRLQDVKLRGLKSTQNLYRAL
jgi:adenylate cyclase